MKSRRPRHVRAVWPFLQRPRGDAGGKKRARARPGACVPSPPRNPPVLLYSLPHRFTAGASRARRSTAPPSARSRRRAAWLWARGHRRVNTVEVRVGRAGARRAVNPKRQQCEGAARARAATGADDTRRGVEQSLAAASRTASPAACAAKLACDVRGEAPRRRGVSRSTLGRVVFLKHQFCVW